MEPVYLIDLIGYHGPYLLFVVACFFLWTKPYYLVTYVLGFMVNMASNRFFKGIIKEPRPLGDLDIYQLGKKHAKRHSHDVYGMPSGHSQEVFYTISYLFFTLGQNISLVLAALFVSLNTLRQRVKFQNHTVSQVVIGSIVGATIGYLFYLVAKKNIIGKIREKMDDNGPDSSSFLLFNPVVN